jgi:hypothetical protein
MTYIFKSFSLIIFLILGGKLSPIVALPPPEDTPEEILRTEIITEGRSPLDGQPLSAAEYAELEAKLAERPYPPVIAAKLQNLLFLLRIRKFFTTITPL